MINIKNVDPNKIKIAETSYKNIQIYYIGYVTSNRVKHLYFKESNGNRYLPLLPTNESKDTLKKYEEIWSKNRDLPTR